MMLFNPYRLIGLMGRVFANGSGSLGSIPGWVIPKTQKMVLDASLLNTQQYKVHIKGKVEQSMERSSTLGVLAIEKRAFWSPLTRCANFTYLIHSKGDWRFHTFLKSITAKGNIIVWLDFKTCLLWGHSWPL